MKRNGMPKAYNKRPTAEVRFDLPPQALNRWDSGIRAASDTGDNTISIFDVIGADYWTGEGVTAAKIAGLLRFFGEDADVTVNINSPGGDMFEGLAIYSLFREHKGDVTVKVLGVAASAASIIAMSADKLEIGRSAFLMIHNAWFVVAGNRNDLRGYADHLEPFDRAMADIYAARTGSTPAEMSTIMDNETWIGGAEAVDTGFADSLLASDAVLHDDSAPASAAAKLDSALAKSGMPRTERRALMKELKSGTPSATVQEDTPRAVDDELLTLSSQLKSIFQ